MVEIYNFLEDVGCLSLSGEVNPPRKWFALQHMGIICVCMLSLEWHQASRQ